MFKRSTTSECGITQHTTTTIQYERYNTDGAKICSRKQRTKYDRRYDEEANRARRRGSVSGKPERHTRENFHTHYDSSPLTFGRHEEPMRNLFCTRNKKIETRRKISQSATICRIFLGGKLARSRSSSSSTQDPPTRYQVHEEHACSFFLYALSDEPFSDHMSTNLCLPHEATAASAAHPGSILAMTEGTAT